MTQLQMTIGGESVPLTIVRKKIKNIYLYVLPPDGALKITCPHGVSDKEISVFLQTKESWILEKRKKVWGQPSRHRLFQEDGSLSLLGVSHPVITTSFQRKNTIGVENGIVTISTVDNSQTQKEALVLSLYRRELQEVVDRLVPIWEASMGVNTTFVGVRKMHTRWGSCSPLKRRIWFSLYLGAMSVESIEYVVVHELSHILEPSHNKRFYSIMSQFLPDWKERKSLLNIR